MTDRLDLATALTLSRTLTVLLEKQRPSTLGGIVRLMTTWNV